MKFTIIRKSELATATWKGGTTTQLFIYPAGTEYQKFNFDFRMSYATVEIPESTFTFMPGVTRHLMILKGELQIDHTDRYKKDLKPFDQDVFNGEWPTTAKGMVTDFNLMTRNNYSGSIKALLLNKPAELSVPSDSTWLGIYSVHGSTEVVARQDKFTLAEGDFVIFESSGSLSLTPLSNSSTCVAARVKKIVKRPVVFRLSV